MPLNDPPDLTTWVGLGENFPKPRVRLSKAGVGLALICNDLINVGPEEGVPTVALPALLSIGVLAFEAVEHLGH